MIATNSPGFDREVHAVERDHLGFTDGIHFAKPFDLDDVGH